MLQYRLLDGSLVCDENILYQPSRCPHDVGGLEVLENISLQVTSLKIPCANFFTMERKRNSSFSLGLLMMNFLAVLLFAQCCLSEVVNSPKFRGINHLQLRQTDPPPPDPPVPKIDSVESTKRYIKAPANNKGAFWSGIPFPLSQSAAEAAGLQTLEQSVPPEITNHPEGQRGTPTNPQFWDWFSEGFSETIVESGSTEVTVLLRAPNRLLTGPSDPLTDGRMVSRSSKSKTYQRKTHK